MKQNSRKNLFINRQRNMNSPVMADVLNNMQKEINEINKTIHEMDNSFDSVFEYRKSRKDDISNQSLNRTLRFHNKSQFLSKSKTKSKSKSKTKSRKGMLTPENQKEDDYEPQNYVPITDAKNRAKSKSKGKKENEMIRKQKKINREKEQKNIENDIDMDDENKDRNIYYKTYKSYINMQPHEQNNKENNINNNNINYIGKIKTHKNKAKSNKNRSYFITPGTNKKNLQSQFENNNDYNDNNSSFSDELETIATKLIGCSNEGPISGTYLNETRNINDIYNTYNNNAGTISNIGKNIPYKCNQYKIESSNNISTSKTTNFCNPNNERKNSNTNPQKNSQNLQMLIKVINKLKEENASLNANQDYLLKKVIPDLVNKIKSYKSTNAILKSENEKIKNANQIFINEKKEMLSQIENMKAFIDKLENEKNQVLSEIGRTKSMLELENKEEFVKLQNENIYLNQQVMSFQKRISKLIQENEQVKKELTINQESNLIRKDFYNTNKKFETKPSLSNNENDIDFIDNKLSMGNQNNKNFNDEDVENTKTLEYELEKNQLQNQINSLNEEKNNLYEQVNDLINQNKELATQINDLKINNINNMNMNNMNNVNSNNSSLLNNSNMVNEYKNMKEENQKLNKIIQFLDSKLSNMENENKTLKEKENENTILNGQLDQLNKELESFKETNSNLMKENNSYKNMLKKTSNPNERTNDKTNINNSKTNNNDNDIFNIGNLIQSSLKNCVESRDNNILNDSSNVVIPREEYENLLKNNSDLNKQLEGKENMANKQADELNEKLRIIDTLHGSIAKLNKEKDNIKNENKNLLNVIENNKAEIKNLREAFDQSAELRKFTFGDGFDDKLMNIMNMADKNMKNDKYKKEKNINFINNVISQGEMFSLGTINENNEGNTKGIMNAGCVKGVTNFLKNENQNLKMNNEKLMEELNELKSNLKELENKYEMSNGKIRDYEKDIKYLKNENAINFEELKKHQNQNLELLNRITIEENQNENLKEKLVLLENENAELKENAAKKVSDENEARKENIRGNNKEENENKQEHQSAGSHEDQKDNNSMSSNEAKTLKNEIKTLKEDIENKEQQLYEIENELEGFKEVNNKLIEDNNHLKDQLVNMEKLQQENKSILLTLNNLKKEITGKNNEMKGLKDENDTLKRASNQLGPMPQKSLSKDLKKSKSLFVDKNNSSVNPNLEQELANLRRFHASNFNIRNSSAGNNKKQSIKGNTTLNQNPVLNGTITPHIGAISNNSNPFGIMNHKDFVQYNLNSKNSTDNKSAMQSAKDGRLSIGSVGLNDSEKYEKAKIKLKEYKQQLNAEIEQNKQLKREIKVLNKKIKELETFDGKIDNFDNFINLFVIAFDGYKVKNKDQEEAFRKLGQHFIGVQKIKNLFDNVEECGDSNENNEDNENNINNNENINNGDNDGFSNNKNIDNNIDNENKINNNKDE